MIDSQKVLYSKGNNDECITPPRRSTNTKIHTERLGGLVSVRHRGE